MELLCSQNTSSMLLILLKSPQFDRFSAIPIKILASFFVDTYKLILKFMWKGKGTKIINSIKNKVGGFKLYHLKTY